MTLLFQNKEKLFFCRTNNYLTETNFKTFKSKHAWKLALSSTSHRKSVKPFREITWTVLKVFCLTNIYLTLQFYIPFIFRKDLFKFRNKISVTNDEPNKLAPFSYQGLIGTLLEKVNYKIIVIHAKHPSV